MPWERKCNHEWFGEQFAPGLRALQSAVDSVVTEYAGPPIPTSPEAYFGRIAVVVGDDDLDYDWEDFGPAGELAESWARGGVHVALDGEFGNLLSRAIDTGHEQDSDWDQNVERHDVEALTNPDSAAMQIRSAAASLGYQLDEDMVQALVPVVVTNAWLTLSIWDDQTEADLESRLVAWEQQPGPRPSAEALEQAPVLDVRERDDDGSGSADVLPMVVDGAGVIASMLPEDLLFDAAPGGVAANGLQFMFLGGATIEGCVDGDNCAGSIAAAAADGTLSVAFPIGWPIVKYSGWGILNAVGGMMEESPDLPASWPTMGAVEGQTPADAHRDDYEPGPNLTPNGGNPGGQLDYGGPDCAGLALSGLDDETPECSS